MSNVFCKIQLSFYLFFYIYNKMFKTFYTDAYIFGNWIQTGKKYEDLGNSKNKINSF